MTDYAAPTTPAAALRVAARDLHAEAKAHLQEARYRSQMAEECERIAYNLESEADLYDKYQPSDDKGDPASASERSAPPEAAP